MKVSARLVRILAAASCVLMLTGAVWVGKYKVPRDKPTADLVLVRGATELGRTSLQLFQAYDNAECRDGPRHGVIGSLMTHEKEKRTKAVAGERIYLLFATNGYSGIVMDREPALRTDMCFNLVSLEPQAGAVYHLRQELASTGCKVIASAEDGSPVASLQEHRAAECKQAR